MFTKVMIMFGLMLALNGVADDDGTIVNINNRRLSLMLIEFWKPGQQWWQESDTCSQPVPAPPGRVNDDHGGDDEDCHGF